MPSTMQMQSISGIITQTHNTLGEVPPPLVGASINVINDKVYVFAGRLASSRKMTNHLYVLDLCNLRWTRHIPPPDSDKPPQARYFHSASVHDSQLIIFGGMGYSRQSTGELCVMDDVSVLDIETMCWKKIKIQPSLYSPQSRYAHLATVVDDRLVVLGGQDLESNYLDEMNVLDLKTWEWEMIKALDKHVGAYRSMATAVSLISKVEQEKSKEESVKAIEEKKAMSGLYLYTNSNFSDVNRELQLILSNLSVEDYSSHMTGSLMPPGLRFPSGHALGNHLILAGTYLCPQSQSYTIWSLDLSKLTWSRIETGSIFQSGSWNRGVLYKDKNRFLVFGHTERNLLEDYNHRQINFDHMASVDLEAFGVYDLPKTTCSSLAQEMGLRLLNEPAVCDFYIMTLDNQTIPVNSAVLCQRWPYFAKLIESATSRYLSFPYPQTVVVALLQFIYTDHLLTAQQYQPHILSQLLLLSDMYHLPRLCALATHALHQMLNMTTAPLIFETAALSHQTSLQIRALKMMIAAKKMIQQQQERTRTVSSPMPSSPQPSLTPSLSSEPRSSLFEYQANSASPTLNSFRSRKYSVGATPAKLGKSSFMQSEPDMSEQQQPKEKKKKKAFLEAFGKFSFQN
ncbi:hypothetical protein G6F46_003993 [Rhizopus delemar]|uniref:BTB domain-containing protein n=2 Tax=Rhizopus TaxID=4842 RepID=A0A9P6Z1P1_9FUNG|nr:hypothetical protein G6F55_006412 [Rhizopus delemar]KAG1550245.1 hypothetical protein G6F51_002561 [Rhizopus arrhizus]KAG1495679.1 hypothetical protein G6F54_007005 [Rhizopus delemar]KAG1510134.1 hypothetical protein G6F53_006911 [Rhizopus delemar]KAG1514560.1 hypothetical protein G6F52_009894 [Rhizopus delemar]